MIVMSSSDAELNNQENSRLRNIFEKTIDDYFCKQLYQQSRPHKPSKAPIVVRSREYSTYYMVLLWESM